MSTQTNEFPVGKKPEPGKFTRILWWFSTAIPELIKDCKSDQHRAKIIPPVSRTETVKFIDTPGIRMIRRLHTVVPFSKCGGMVACSFEVLEDGRLVQIHALFAATGRLDTGTRVVATRHKLSSCRRANRANIEAIQCHALRSEPVDVRGADVGVTVDAQVTPALIIGQDDDDVRFVRISGKGLCT